MLAQLADLSGRDEKTVVEDLQVELLPKAMREMIPLI